MFCIWCILFYFLFFFFQAEDGIRDRNVTGVQTCALPILYHENTKPYKETIKGKIKYQLDEKGFLGAMKWMLCYPTKVPRKILNKISKKGR